MGYVSPNQAFYVSAGNPQADLVVQELIQDKADRVHPLLGEGDPVSFCRNRAGTLSHNKQIWVTLRDIPMDDVDGEMVVNLRDSMPAQTVNASLYTFVQTTPIQSERDLHGNVHDILSMDAGVLNADPTAIIFYSVASFKGSTPGAGAAIINNVYDKFVAEENVWLSTLSPLRGLTQWVEKQYGDAGEFYDCPLMQTKLALRYLIANENPVQKFHLNNGAYIGDVKLNANIAGSADYKDGLNVMMNYVYPSPMQRDLNKEAYKAGHLTFSVHLYDEIQMLGDIKIDKMPHIRPRHPWSLRPAMF